MTNMVPIPICGREDWTILMPAERAARVQWPWHEWNRFHSMFHNLRPGDVLFDIGAEQGDQSALYQRWIQRPAWEDPDWRNPAVGTVREGGIVLVEPNEKAWPYIREVWEANDLREPLLCSQAHVGAVPTGWVCSGWPVSSFSRLSDYVGTAELATEDDPVVTIDDLALEILPDAITVDIEGGEHDALRGAAFTLDEHKPLVWVSIHWQMLLERGQCRDGLIDYMASFGYEHEHLGQDHEIHALFWHPEGRRPVLPYDGVAGS